MLRAGSGITYLTVHHVPSVKELEYADWTAFYPYMNTIIIEPLRGEVGQKLWLLEPFYDRLKRDSFVRIDQIPGLELE